MEQVRSRNKCRKLLARKFKKVLAINYFSFNKVLKLSVKMNLNLFSMFGFAFFKLNKVLMDPKSSAIIDA